MAAPAFKEVKEQKRTYYYHPDRSYTFDKVNKVAISKSTHRLETSDNKKFIVRDNWDVIELVMDEWSF
jgi:hypothetical protein